MPRAWAAHFYAQPNIYCKCICIFLYLSQIQKYTIRSHIRSTWFHIFGLQGFTYLVYYASHIWSTRVHRQNLLKSPSHTHIYKATLHFAASLPLLVCVNFLCSIIMLHLVLLQFAIHLSAPIGTFQQALDRLYHSLLLKKHDQIQLLVRNMTIDILKHAAGYFPVLPVDWNRWLPCQQQRVLCTFVHLYICTFVYRTCTVSAAGAKEYRRACSCISAHWKQAHACILQRLRN